jgi:hypothetical protein
MLPATFFGRLFGRAPRVAAVHVSATRIFARRSADERQALAYQMKLTTPAPVAMVLPLPTPPGDATALEFVDLSAVPDLFARLERAFPAPQELGLPKSQGILRGGGPKLEVVPVGDFVASFVPTIADFVRLDERFRLPARVWEALPRYADWGFAVFQLGEKTVGKQDVHPMAFTFRTRTTTKLFFPTVHVHDGAVHPQAHFDHTLYAQGARLAEASSAPAESVVDLAKVRAIVGPGPLARTHVHGLHPNEDQWYDLEESA